MLDLFTDAKPQQESPASGVVIFRRFAFGSTLALLRAIAAVARQSPFRQMVTSSNYIVPVTVANYGYLG